MDVNGELARVIESTLEGASCELCYADGRGHFFAVTHDGTRSEVNADGASVGRFLDATIYGADEDDAKGSKAAGKAKGKGK